MPARKFRVGGYWTQTRMYVEKSFHDAFKAAAARRRLSEGEYAQMAIAKELEREKVEANKS